MGTATAECVSAMRERIHGDGVDHVVACCDSGRSFRWEIAEEYKAIKPDYKGYKGHRREKDPAMMAALGRVVEELESDGIPVLSYKGAEGDDIIATITFWAVENGHDVEIVSDDKDCMQLIRDPERENDPCVRVVSRHGVVTDRAAVLAKFGVPPEKLGAYLALTGDDSDGVEGIDGIGGVKAAALLWGWFDKAKVWHWTPFKSFAEVVTAAVAEQAQEEENARVLADARERKVRPLPRFPAARFSEATRKALIGGDRMFDISQRLTRLWHEVPIDCSVVTAPREPKPRPVAPQWSEPDLPSMPMPSLSEPVPVHFEEEPMPEITPPSASVVTGEPVATPANQMIVAPPAKAIQRVDPASFRIMLEPMDYMAARIVAGDAYESKLFKIENPQAAIAIIQLGREHGMGAMSSLMEIDMIEGKPTMKARLMVALVRKSGKADYFKLIESSPTGAKWKTHRRDDPDMDPTFGTFTIDEAKQALLGGIWNKDKKERREHFAPDSNYSKWPEDMCVWRAAARLIRREYSDVIGNLYATEELTDSAPMDGYSEAA